MAVAGCLIVERGIHIDPDQGSKHLRAIGRDTADAARVGGVEEDALPAWAAQRHGSLAGREILDGTEVARHELIGQGYGVYGSVNNGNPENNLHAATFSPFLSFFHQ